MKKILKIFSILLVLMISAWYYHSHIRTVGSGTIPVITYHSINDINLTDNEYIISPATFESMVKELKDNNFNFLSLDDVEKIMDGNMKLPSNPICITFDDGYEDNYTNAYPILKKYHAVGNVFLIGAYIDTTGFLTGSEIREMSDSGVFSFGSHTYNLHDSFTEGKNKGKTWLSAKLEGESDEHYHDKIVQDLVWNNNLIYKYSSVFPSSIAYPGAMVNDQILKAVKDSNIKIGFVGANKTATKVGEKPYEIHRFHIKPDTNIKNMVRFLKSN